MPEPGKPTKMMRIADFRLYGILEVPLYYREIMTGFAFFCVENIKAIEIFPFMHYNKNNITCM